MACGWRSASGTCRGKIAGAGPPPIGNCSKPSTSPSIWCCARHRNLDGLSDVHFSKPLAGLMLTIESANQAAGDYPFLPECRFFATVFVGDLDDFPLDAFCRAIDAISQVDELDLPITSGAEPGDGPVVEGDDVVRLMIAEAQKHV